MTTLERIGCRALEKWRYARDIAAVIHGVLCLALKPRYWPRTVRQQIARQILFTGVDAIGLTFLIAILAGISIVVQAQVWLSRFGQSEMLGPLLVAIIVREIGPLLVNLVVIGRSGTAVAIELANMRVRHEINILDAQGVDPMVYLVMPRMLAIVISVFCLTIVFIAVSFISGYLLGFLLGAAPSSPSLFAAGVMGVITPRDISVLMAKVLVPGFITGAICCMEGLSIGGLVTEVPQAATRSLVRSIAAVLVVSAVVSVLTYV